MDDRRDYEVSIPLTDEEARTLLDTAAARGETIGIFLSGIVTDILNGDGDEGHLIRAYLDRSEPVRADDSFVGFCLRNGWLTIPSWASA